MQITFWGTRGSIPTPGPTTVRYGGNTSCVQLRSQSGSLVILDAGTGLRSLGSMLSKSGEKPLRGHILITHTHWDHIQGLPFFAPLFASGNEWDIYAPKGFEQSLRETLAGQMQYTYFPVTLEQLGSHIRYHELVEGEFKVGDITVKTQYLNHPAVTLGYRLEADGVSVVYATDHEPNEQHLAAGLGVIGDQDQRHVSFLSNADLVIHDAQYISKEYEEKKGWGHSTAEYVIEVCDAAHVKRIALTHHDPMRDDASLDRLVQEMRAILKQKNSSTEVFAAAEGQSLILEKKENEPKEEKNSSSALASDNAPVSQKKVIVGIENPIPSSTLIEALQASNIESEIKEDTQKVVKAALQQAPSLVIVENKLPNMDGSAVCQELRSSNKDFTKELPIILVADREEDVNQAAGATDWLVKPFSANYAKARIQAWLLRKTLRWIKAPLPADEKKRLEYNKKLKVLETPAEERFDRITRLASALFDMPIVKITFLDEKRQWVKSCIGCDRADTSREESFCAHTLFKHSLMVIPDTHLDPRFADNPLVVGEPYIRFYAGQPLILPDDTCLGTLCLIGTEPRSFSDQEASLLKDLSDIVIEELI